MEKIKYYTDILGHIFDNINKEICSDCPLARRKTVLEVEGRYGFEIWSKEAGCCSSCKKYMGHFSDVNNGSPIEYMECKQVLERLKKKYKYDDKLYGFFDSLKKECKLPREKRSLTCLRYNCNFIRKKLEDKFGSQVYNMLNWCFSKIEDIREGGLI